MSNGLDLMGRIASAGSRMDPALSNWDVERLVSGARQLRQNLRARRIVVAAVAACAGIVALVVLARRGPEPSSHVALTAKHSTVQLPGQAAPAANSIVRLSDGSTAVALDSTTQITLAQDVTERAELVLSRGRGRFDVKPRPTRAFVVHAGNVTITVLGTLFTVERVADRVGVTVESGTVRVDWGVGSAVLEENNSGWYPPLVISKHDEQSSPENDAASPSGGPTRNGVSGATLETTTSSVPAKTERESAADLLAAADKARISGHTGQATELLRKLLREHRKDARAPLAAFTLGRILLMELSRPLDAAAAFAEARRLSPGGPFAEDALAREVEAYSKAGVPVQARARAEEFLRLYPEGRRAANVRVMGGIK